MRIVLISASAPPPALQLQVEIEGRLTSVIVRKLGDHADAPWPGAHDMADEGDGEDAEGDSLMRPNRRRRRSSTGSSEEIAEALAPVMARLNELQPTRLDAFVQQKVGEAGESAVAVA